jgi:ricin-type beta-trefoil lectin protein
MSKTLAAGLALGLGLLAACQQDAVAPSTRSGSLANSAGTPEMSLSAGAVTPTAAHGVNFLIRTQADITFCIAVVNGTTEGRDLFLQQCGNADNQRWALALNSDDTNPIIDFQGMCVDGHFAKAAPGAALTVAKCESGDNWHFTFTPAGLLQNVKNHMCVAVPIAVTSATVNLEACDATKLTQLWQLAH